MFCTCLPCDEIGKLLNNLVYVYDRNTLLFLKYSGLSRCHVRLEKFSYIFIFQWIHTLV